MFVIEEESFSRTNVVPAGTGDHDLSPNVICRVPVMPDKILSRTDSGCFLVCLQFYQWIYLLVLS